jgi:hypothetical protein
MPTDNDGCAELDDQSLHVSSHLESIELILLLDQGLCHISTSHRGLASSTAGSAGGVRLHVYLSTTHTAYCPCLCACS